MNFKNLAMWAIIVFLTIGLYNMFKNPQSNISKKNSINFSEFLTEVDNGRVVQVEIKGNNINGVLSDGNNFTTYAPNDPNLIEKLSSKGVAISAAPLDEKMPSLFGVLLSWFPMLLLIAVWIFFMRQMQGGKGGAMGFGRSKAKMMNELKGKVTFNDVAGVEEAKEEVEEVVEFLRDPKKFSRLGGKIPRGCLLVGPPGTGKTLLARAIAGEAGVPFFTISGSDFVEMFVGVGASRVRDMFEQGKKHSPCIIFIDEIDAVGRSRGAGLGGGLMTDSGYSLMLVANYEYHVARDPSLGLDKLTRWSLDVEGGRWFFQNKLKVGLWSLLGASFNQMDAQSEFETLRALPELDPFFGTVLGGGMMLKYQLNQGLHLVGSGGLQMMFRSHRQQLRLSFLLPVQVGIRYE